MNEHFIWKERITKRREEGKIQKKTLICVHMIICRCTYIHTCICKHWERRVCTHIFLHFYFVFIGMPLKATNWSALNVHRHTRQMKEDAEKWKVQRGCKYVCMENSKRKPLAAHLPASIRKSACYWLICAHNYIFIVHIYI